MTNGKKFTFEYVKNYIEKKGYKLISKEYVNSKIKLKVKCSKNHEYEINFSSFKMGNKCKICYYEKQRHPIEFVKNYIENEGYKLLSTEYINAQSKLKVKCPKNHEYEVKFNNFKMGNKCKICSDIIGHEKLKHSFKFVENYIKSKKYELLSEIYINVMSKLKVKCPKNHEYPVTFNSFKNSKTRCPICSYKEGGERRKYSFEYVKNYIKNKEYKLLSEDYINNRVKLKVKCPKNHEYEVSFSSFKNSQSRCPYCNDYKNENKCRDIFERLTRVKFLKMRHKWIRNPKTNFSLELDGYCEELNLAFEYDGDQHHKYNKFFHKYTSLEEIQFKDQFKDQLCIENGIKLLRIKYDIEDKEELIKDFLIENNVEI